MSISDFCWNFLYPSVQIKVFTIMRVLRAFSASALFSFFVLCVNNPSFATVLFSVTHANNRINQLDPSNGALLNSFAPPVLPQNQGGNGLAFSGSTLFYTTIDAPLIYSLNPVSGAILNSFARPAGSSIDALGFGASSFGNTLFALDYPANRVNLINPTTGAVFNSYVVGFDAVGGVDFNSVAGTLFVSDQSGAIRELNPNSGTVLNTFNTGLFQYGLGFVGGNLFTSDNGGLIVQRNPSTGAILNSFASPGGYASALAGGPAVPEPSSLVIFALAACVGTFVGRRTKNS